MSTETLAPIIVKKKKIVQGGGHHGGAWKVAYADFVTAMMAFFLLMWLLNATTEKQRSGLADYFSPTIPVHKISGGGDGQFWGNDVFSEEVMAQSGTGATQANPTEANQARGATGVEAKDAPELGEGKEAKLREAEHLLETLQARGGESMAQLREMRYVTSKLTEEGLVFEIFETDDVRLFDPDTGLATNYLRTALRSLAGVSRIISNDMSVSSHLAARPLVMASNPIWDISSAQAHEARLTIQRGGFPAHRIQKVIGYADRKPAVRDPMARRNNRVEITFLREGV